MLSVLRPSSCDQTHFAPPPNVTAEKISSAVLRIEPESGMKAESHRMQHKLEWFLKEKRKRNHTNRQTGSKDQVGRE